MKKLCEPLVCKINHFTLLDVGLLATCERDCKYFRNRNVILFSQNNTIPSPSYTTIIIVAKWMGKVF